MVTGKIKFTSVDDVKNFVNTVSKYKTNVDIKYGAIELDGKSIQGLLAIQLHTKLDCTIHDTLANASDIIDNIKPYVIEDFK